MENLATGSRPRFFQPRYYVRLHARPVHFADGTLNESSFDGVDNVYVLVCEHRETLSETLD